MEAGTSIHFRITVARDQRCSGARLVVTADTGGSQTLGLFWCGMNGDAYEWWECHYTAPAAGLYFYEFYVDTWHGCLRLGRGFNGADVIDPKAPRWQLTVYEKGFTTPDWPGRRRDVSDLPGPLLLLRQAEAARAGRPHAAPGLGRRAVVEAE